MRDRSHLLARLHQDYADTRSKNRFERIAGASLIQGLTAAGTSLGLALAWRSYWALILGFVAGKAAHTAVLLAMCPVRPSWPRSADMGSFLKFGGMVTGSRILWYFREYFDVVVVGAVLGAKALGVFTMAMTLARLPVEKISVVLAPVLFPVFSRNQLSDERLRDQYRQTLAGIAMIAFPAAAGMALVALAPFVAFFTRRYERVGFIALGFSSILIVLVLVSAVLHVGAWGLEAGTVSLTLVGSAALLTAAGSWHARRPGVVRVDVPITDLPQDLERLRIVQLSDLHVGPTLKRDFVEAVVALREHGAQPRRQAAPTVVVAEERLEQIGVERVGHLAGAAAWIHGVGRAVQNRAVFRDEMVPGGRVALGAGTRQRELLEEGRCASVSGSASVASFQSSTCTNTVSPRCVVTPQLRGDTGPARVR